MKSISSVSETMFHPVKSFAEESSSNWNMLLCLGLVLLLLGVILTYVFQRKLGKPDERTKQVSLKSGFIILFGIILCDVIFPKTYMWEIFFIYKYAMAFIASGIYLAIRYKKDFYS